MMLDFLWTYANLNIRFDIIIIYDTDVKKNCSNEFVNIKISLKDAHILVCVNVC
jgi:hypothetical protein